jgi:hypothetical protein
MPVENAPAIPQNTVPVSQGVFAGPADSGLCQAVLAELALAAGSPVLLAYTRGTAKAAAEVCSAARSAGLDVRLLGLPRWEPKDFLRRLQQAAGTWPEAVTRQGVLIVIEDFDLQELADLRGFRLLRLRPETNVSALDPARTDLGAAAWPAQLTAALPGPQVVVIGRDGQALVMRRQHPLGWERAPVPPEGQLVQWPIIPQADTAIDTADGQFVADGEWGVNRRWRGTVQLGGSPISITVCSGMVTEVRCRDPRVGRFLNRAVQVHKASRVVTATLAQDADGKRTVTLTVARQGTEPYSPASADLRFWLRSASSAVRGDPPPQESAVAGRRES